MRRLRGKGFNELDLYDLAAYAANHAEHNVVTVAAAERLLEQESKDGKETARIGF